MSCIVFFICLKSLKITSFSMDILFFSMNCWLFLYSLIMCLGTIFYLLWVFVSNQINIQRMCWSRRPGMEYSRYGLSLMTFVFVTKMFLAAVCLCLCRGSTPLYVKKKLIFGKTPQHHNELNWGWFWNFGSYKHLLADLHWYKEPWGSNSMTE